jgi:hypothetical protein
LRVFGAGTTAGKGSKYQRHYKTNQDQTSHMNSQVMEIV